MKSVSKSTKNRFKNIVNIVITDDLNIFLKKSYLPIDKVGFVCYNDYNLEGR